MAANGFFGTCCYSAEGHAGVEAAVPICEDINAMDVLLPERGDEQPGMPMDASVVDELAARAPESAAAAEPVLAEDVGVEAAVEAVADAAAVEGARAESIFATAAAQQQPTRSRGGAAVVILVNPKSGGNAAGVLLELPREGQLVQLPGGRASATVFSYPIADAAKEGIRHLAAEVHASTEGDPVRCIVAGGDGTVMWAIQEILEAEIPTDRVLVGTIPFGTGNDFGNVTGWGTSGPARGFLREAEGFAGLQNYVRAWLQADAAPYDIWEFSVLTRSSENARFEFIENGKKVCTDKHIARHGIQRLPSGQLEMSKYVCNYVGFGLDARVGFGFDKLRQNNRALNKGVYVWEGIKKLLFKKKGVIGHIVDSMQVLPSSSSIGAARDGHGVVDKPAPADAPVVFSTSQAAPPETPQLAGNPVSLLFLNIPSISGGLDIWKWSTRKLGTSSDDKDLLAVRQDFGDGRLECLSYRTGAGFYLEQARTPPISGQGNRIYSGAGPLRINFRSPADAEYVKGTKHCKGRTYMQIDGEFFSVHEPESVVIKHHASIRVILNSEAKACC